MREPFIKFYIVLAFCLIYGCVSCFGQYGDRHHLNTETGLPSDYIYSIISDRNGYLWFATPKGLAKYNGYEFKIFGLADGLPKEDIWALCEDKKGRIWLGCISEEMGYMLNDKYCSAKLRNISSSIYPTLMTPSKNGLVFTSPFIGVGLRLSICSERNDTITNYQLPSAFKVKDGFRIKNVERSARKINGVLHEEVFFKENGAMGFIYGNKIYGIGFRNDSILITNTLAIRDTDFEIKAFGYTNFTRRDYAIFYGTFTDLIFVNLQNGAVECTDLKRYGINESIEFVYHQNNNDSFFVITKNYLLEYAVEKQINCVKIVPFKDIKGKSTFDGSEVKVMYLDELWGRCMGTNTDGAWIYEKNKTRFAAQSQIDIKGFKYVGLKGDDGGLWWNSKTAMLANIHNDLTVTYSRHSPVFKKIDKITPYNKDTFMVTGMEIPGTSWYISSRNKFMPSYLDSACKNVKTIIRKYNGSLVLVDVQGLFEVGAGYKPKILKSRFEKLNDLLYDSITHTFWAYNAYKIVLYDTNKRDSSIPRNELQRFGIDLVEKIVVDNRYGNIFFKGSQKSESCISMYNPKNNGYRKLFNNYNLRSANVYIYHNMLVVAGRFGILFSQIKGEGAISDPVSYPNIKDFNYKDIYDVQLSGNTVLLNTDKGVYTVKFPEPEEFRPAFISAKDSYNFIVTYKDSSFRANTGDTINLSQKDIRLQFDIINPEGNGKASYKYRFSDRSEWRVLNANELSLPAYVLPGKYYTLYLKVNDNVWRSPAIKIVVYIHPYWWQVMVLNRFFWPCVTLAILLLVGGTAMLTRRAVNKNNIKRNLKRELELRSVHSQINPHFIYNTLNTALYFIKMNELAAAYTHVTRFSKLLRAYIRSSRSKYIGIAEEVENLSNYIQLQQSRFEDKFVYEISVAEDINNNNVKIPAMLLQPIVENAIDHGLFHKQDNGCLKIAFSLASGRHDAIECVIDDNGIGRYASRQISTDNVVQKESYGGSLVKELVDIFNKYENSGIAITYIDKELPLTGTTVIIKIARPVYDK